MIRGLIERGPRPFAGGGNKRPGYPGAAEYGGGSPRQPSLDEATV